MTNDEPPDLTDAVQKSSSLSALLAAQTRARDKGEQTPVWSIPPVGLAESPWFQIRRSISENGAAFFVIRVNDGETDYLFNPTVSKIFWHALRKYAVEQKFPSHESFNGLWCVSKKTANQPWLDWQFTRSG